MNAQPTSVPQNASPELGREADPWLLGDGDDVRDLAQFLTRAAGLRDGVARLVARGSVGAVHVAASFPLMLGGAAPLIVGQRGVRLTRTTQTDVVVPAAEVRDRLARLRTKDDDGAGLALGLPPSRPSAPWTSLLPLAARWEERESVGDDAMRERAARVAEAVHAALPDSPGQPLLFQAREALWSEPAPELGDGFIAGAAFVAHAYGFLREGSRSRRFTAGPWERLSSQGGTLLWRAGTP